MLPLQATHAKPGSAINSFLCVLYVVREARTHITEGGIDETDDVGHGRWL